MKKIDYRLNEGIFSHMVGKHFLQYKCDPFIFTNKVYSVIGIYIDHHVYQLKNEQEPVDYFGFQEDMGVWNIKEVTDSDIKSALVDVKQISTPVEEKIESISLVIENQQLFENNIQTYDIWLTRAILFHTQTRDICFEKDEASFSEHIEIKRGHDLIKDYPKENTFFLKD